MKKIERFVEMCGIVGVFRSQGSTTTEAEIKAMNDEMAHRGPDGSGVWESNDKRCLLGHRRLSIIDLSSEADQPMVNAKGNISIVFNGEIYNHAEIRKELEELGHRSWKTHHSDTEALLYAYEEWGLGCLKKLHGMFAFAIYDQRNPNDPVLHLVRDRMGVKPLYFTKTAMGEWIFASEIKSILRHRDVSREMDPTAFYHYLTFVISPAPLTLFKNIFKIPAGHYASIKSSGQTEAFQWYDLKPNPERQLKENDISLDEASDQLVDLLRTSVNRRMVSDVPFGALLSGGVDSSLNVALMAEQMSRPVTTFTVGYQGEEEFNEFQYARKVANKYQTDHHEVLINRDEVMDFLPKLVQIQDEPIADNVCIPLFFLAKLVKDQGTTVVQMGEGADETFLGYWWCAHYFNKDRTVYQKALKKNRFRDFYTSLFSHGPFKNLNYEDQQIFKRARMGHELFWGGATCWWGDLRRQLTPDQTPFQSKIDCPIEGLMQDSHATLDDHEVVRSYLSRVEQRCTDPKILQKMTYMEYKLRLPEHLLMRVDKLTMAHSVEAREPFLDKDLLEFANILPPSYKNDGKTGKKILKKAAEKFLDHEIIYRKKQGFGAPMEKWFKHKDFASRSRRAFERSRLIKDGFFDNKFLFKLFEGQVGTSGGYSSHLWTILNAVLWYESWIEKKEDCF